ncbi:ATP-binding protein [Helicobacter fennelliae]|nr:ATP-binding protein [Helicobacter fennelliae]SQB99637.1 two-component sensor Histidine kinase [Helicobacter fennelliae]STP07239.1 two-component sensor Histidine kinase [Helicobacter fennelliae]STQ85177.1 two-component sensor Histidine kinase [Helicobacter fennelliae]
MPFKSLQAKVVFLFCLAICFATFFSYQVDKIMRKNEIIHSKSEIIYLVRTITPNIIINHFVSVKFAIDQFGFERISALPKGYEILYENNENSQNAPHILIFNTQDSIGFQITHKTYSIIAQRPIEYGFIGRGQLWFFLGFFISVIIALGLIVLRLLYPLRQIQNAIKNFSQHANQAIYLHIKRDDEIGDLAQSFNAMSQKVSNVLLTKQLLLRSIGHELKTPLAKMKLFVEVEKQNGNPSASKFLDFVNDLQQLIDNLLEYGRLSSDKTKLNLQTFSAETLALKALESFDKSQDKILLDFKDNFSIQGDLRLLSIAFKNLIDNALKYNQADSITITIAQHRICVISESPPLNRAFSFYLEPFVRDANHETMPGHGLGLPIVNDILNLHHFCLEYEYKDGKHYFSMIFKN